ncbi:MAG: hypothetical protein QM765_15625 [Myxococcales bacterium]
MRPILAVAGTLAMLAGCGNSKPVTPPPATALVQLPVDSSLRPDVATLLGPEGTARPVARMRGESGVVMDFVLGELLVATGDEAKLDGFLGRWGGAVLATIDKVGDQPPIHRVKLDPSPASLEAILSGLAKTAPDLKAKFTVSSADAAKLLAVALDEANGGGMTVTPNFVPALQAIATGSTTEAPSGDSGYMPDSFTWPYMNRGSA